MDREKIKKELWEIITYNLIKYSKYNLTTKMINKNMKSIDIFPTHLIEEEKENEHADRFGYALIQIVKEVENKYNIKINIKYAARSEYDEFEYLDDISKFLLKEIYNSVKRKGGE